MTRFVRVYLDELLVALALLGGWALVTAGLARLVPGPVWLFSGGLFLLSAVGWRFLYLLVRDGLYARTRPKPPR